jgi:hypothetical protein
MKENRDYENDPLFNIIHSNNNIVIFIGTFMGYYRPRGWYNMKTLYEIFFSDNYSRPNVDPNEIELIFTNVKIVLEKATDKNIYYNDKELKIMFHWMIIPNWFLF